MKRIILAGAVGLSIGFVLAAAPAAAQNARSFVSGHGNDANSCQYAAPCRTFAAAYAVTNPSGEITILDPAGYGALTIGKSISIVNDGVGEAGIIVTSGEAITINAGANDTVTLRGLTLEGSGTATTGIRFQAGEKVTVENCVVRHFGAGVSLLNSISNATMNLVVTNSTVSDNSEGFAIQISGSNDTITGAFDHVQAINNSGTGILIDGFGTSSGTVRATVSDSLVSNNGYGISSEATPGQATTAVVVERSTVTNNGIGLYANGAGSTLNIGRSVLAANTTHGWQEVSSGSVGTYGDNYIENNGANVGSISVLPKQ